MVVKECNHSFEIEVGILEVQIHTHVHSKFEYSVKYRRH